MQTLTTTWTSGGEGFIVETQRKPGEDTLDFVRRHYADVAVQQVAHPPDNHALETVEGY